MKYFIRAFAIFSILAFNIQTSFGISIEPVQIILDSIDTTYDERDSVYFKVEQMPEFPGGDIALRRFIVEKIVYPKEASEYKIYGRVYVRFVITETGKVTDVQIARGVDESIDNEAIRVIKLLPDFKPGIQNGKPVSVYYIVPIYFNTYH